MLQALLKKMGIIGGPAPKIIYKNGVTPTPTPTPKEEPKTYAERLTYYLPTGAKTATGTTPKNGYTLAVSPDMEKVASQGSVLRFDNGFEGRVEDRTNKRLKGTVDVYYDSKEQATYPKGMEKNVPFKILRYDPSGLKYNYGKK
jgi:3D (Asp-Asp-Asp) domain-containing protein